MANRLIASIKRANLPDKLGNVIEDTQPVITKAFEELGPPAARGLWNGFKGAPLWAQALTGAFLLAKTRPAWSALGSLASTVTCGRFSSALPGCIAGKAGGGKGGRGAAAGGAYGAAGRVIGAALGLGILAYIASDGFTQSLGASLRRAAEFVFPGSNNNPGVGSPGGRIPPGAADVGPNRPGGLQRRLPDPGPGRGGSPLGPTPIAPLPRQGLAVPGGMLPEVVVPVTLTQDGKPTAKVVARQGAKKKAVK
jgi:hypothetical protein